jgi:hypothetical protein
MKDLLQILLGFLGVAVFLWLYLKVKTFLYERGLVWRQRPPRSTFKRCFTGTRRIRINSSEISLIANR